MGKSEKKEQVGYSYKSQEQVAYDLLMLGLREVSSEGKKLLEIKDYTGLLEAYRRSLKAVQNPDRRRKNS